MKKYFKKRLILTQKQDKHLCGPEMEQNAECKVKSLTACLRPRSSEESGSCWLMEAQVLAVSLVV